jgi:hypothetical protein
MTKMGAAAETNRVGEEVGEAFGDAEEESAGTGTPASWMRLAVEHLAGKSCRGSFEAVDLSVVMSMKVGIAGVEDGGVVDDANALREAEGATGEVDEGVGTAVTSATAHSSWLRPGVEHLAGRTCRISVVERSVADVVGVVVVGSVVDSVEAADGSRAADDVGEGDADSTGPQPVRLAGGSCRFVLREKYWWLVWSERKVPLTGGC